MGTKKETPAVDNPLAQIEAAINDGFSDESLYGSAQVPESPINMPTADAIAKILAGPALIQQGKGITTQKLIKHYDGDRFEAIQSAMAAEEKHTHTPSHYSHDGYEVRMPGQVRERPNSLYFRIDDVGRLFLIREKADAITNVIFGDEAKRVFELADRSGFHLKPLVLVSQLLYHHITNAIPHKFAEYGAAHGDTGFDPEVDDEKCGSPWMEAYHMFLEYKTVNDLAREARYKNVSVLTVMRCIMADICTDRDIPENFGK